MSEYTAVQKFTGKRSPLSYKPAKGGVGGGNFGNIGQKKATKKKISMVDKKVKKISNKVMRFKKGVIPPASQSPSETRSSNNA